MTAMPGAVSGAMCRNQPSVPAVDRCAGCAEPFCANCLVDMNGRKYCGSCKVMALQTPHPIMHTLIAETDGVFSSAERSEHVV